MNNIIEKTNLFMSYKVVNILFKSMDRADLCINELIENIYVWQHVIAFTLIRK